MIFFTRAVMLNWINLAKKEGYFIELGSNSKLLGVQRKGDGEVLEVSITIQMYHFLMFIYLLFFTATKTRS